MTEPKPPTVATMIEFEGRRDDRRFVHALLVRLGAPVGEELGGGVSSVDVSPTTESDSRFSERIEREVWTLGAFTVERLVWHVWDPNDHWDTSGGSTLAWRIHGLADGRSLHLRCLGSCIQVHVSPSVTLALTAQVNLAAVATPPS